MPTPANRPTRPTNPPTRPNPLRWLRTIASALYALYGLFVDDGLFATAILLWLALAIIAAHTNLSPRWRALALPTGLAAILIESLLRASNRPKP